jgi:hypothetical protein
VEEENALEEDLEDLEGLEGEDKLYKYIFISNIYL